MKRLYKSVQVTDDPDGFGIALDNKPLKTPGRLPVRLPTRALAYAIAAEWDAQGDEVRPGTMPLMQLCATALDHIPANRAAVLGATLRFAETDAICYRADQPAELVHLQAARWDPLNAWVAQRYGAGLCVSMGIVPVPQPPASIKALAEVVDAMDDWRLTAFQSAAASSGSFVIALALMDGRIDADEAFRAAELDSEFEIDRWGEDVEATTRRAVVAADLAAARRFRDLLGH